MSEEIRLAKRLMQLQQCSRAEAENYIRSGYVRVDGQVVLLPQHRVTDQQIELAKDAVAERPKPATLLCHLPAGANLDAFIQQLNASSRWAQDPAELRCLSSHFHALQQPLPLAEGMSGLLVLSQDPACLRRLRFDAVKLEQEFAVTVQGKLAENGLRRLNQPLNYQAQGFRPCKVSWLNETTLRFAVKHPKPEQILAMCQSQGLVVEQIKRLRIGAQSLAKVPAGQWRYLLAGARF